MPSLAEEKWFRASGCLRYLAVLDHTLPCPHGAMAPDPGLQL